MKYTLAEAMSECKKYYILVLKCSPNGGCKTLNMSNTACVISAVKNGCRCYGGKGSTVNNKTFKIYIFDYYLLIS